MNTESRADNVLIYLVSVTGFAAAGVYVYYHMLSLNTVYVIHAALQAAMQQIGA